MRIQVTVDTVGLGEDRISSQGEQGRVRRGFRGSYPYLYHHLQNRSPRSYNEVLVQKQILVDIMLSCVGIVLVDWHW